MHNNWAILHKDPINPPVVDGLIENQNFIKSITKAGQCVRPDIRLDMDRTCDCCPYYAFCEYELRIHSKDPAKPKVKKDAPVAEVPVPDFPPLVQAPIDPIVEAPAEPRAETPDEETSSTAEPAPAKKRRGRPPGSKNKPKV